MKLLCSSNVISGPNSPAKLQVNDTPSRKCSKVDNLWGLREDVHKINKIGKGCFSSAFNYCGCTGLGAKVGDISMTPAYRKSAPNERESVERIEDVNNGDLSVPVLTILAEEPKT